MIETFIAGIRADVVERSGFERIGRVSRPHRELLAGRRWVSAHCHPRPLEVGAVAAAAIHRQRIEARAGIYADVGIAGLARIEER